MSMLADDHDMIDNTVESSAGKQYYSMYCITLHNVPSAVEEGSDQGSHDIQWFAVHFLVVWYRDMMEEQGRIKSVIREVIMAKLTTEVSVFLTMYMCICCHLLFCVVGGSQ